MSVNVVDVEEGDVEGFAIPKPRRVVMLVVGTETFRLENVDLNAVLANRCVYKSGGKESDWKQGSELHGEPSERKGSGRRRCQVQRFGRYLSSIGLAPDSRREREAIGCPG